MSARPAVERLRTALASGPRPAATDAVGANVRQAGRTLRAVAERAALSAL